MGRESDTCTVFFFLFLSRLSPVRGIGQPGLASPVWGRVCAAACSVARSQRPKESFRCTHSGSDLHGHLLMRMRTIRWCNGQCPGRNGQWAERIAHAGSEAVRLVPLFQLASVYPSLSSSEDYCVSAWRLPLCRDAVRIIGPGKGACGRPPRYPRYPRYPGYHGYRG